jgi:tetratricopeptide (TPR) repeat protein
MKIRGRWSRGAGWGWTVIAGTWAFLTVTTAWAQTSGAQTNTSASVAKPVAVRQSAPAASPVPASASVSASAPAQASVASASTPAAAVSSAGSAMTFEELKKAHEALLIDYNNVVSQAKSLMGYKNKVRDMEDSGRQFDIAKEQLIKEKEAAQAQVVDLQEQIKNLDAKVVAVTGQKEEYKKSFEKASVENIIGEDTKKKIAAFEKDKAGSSQEKKDLEDRIKLLEAAALKQDAGSELLRRQIGEMKEKYEEARRKNKALEAKLEGLPKRFAELARENKILVKRTALMHYNLGVFYTQNQEFARAIAEFEKAVELNQEDSASYFNLGYIYAEHLQNRPRAVSYFRQFLKLAKKDDKDADWAKRYVLTWQTWEGEAPIK